MEAIILVIHVLLGVGLVVLVLIQQGKGASMGASFGAGASQTVFGSAGGGSLLTRLTTAVVIAFFATSFSLAIMAKNKADNEANPLSGIPMIEQGVAPAAKDGEIPMQAAEQNRSATESGNGQSSGSSEPSTATAEQQNEVPKVETGSKQ